MIIVTGAAGFIGSQMVRRLNVEGYKAIIGVDQWNRPDRDYSQEGLLYRQKIERDELFTFIDQNQEVIEFVVHLGARTDTAEFDLKLLQRLNTEYSQKVWQKCIQHDLPLIYASSAATYGNGDHGYDDQQPIDSLKPLNPYGQSKQDFDLWAQEQEIKPFYWAGLKFFNVYGPFENHKGRMASVIWHAYRQIKETGKMKLFRSHREGIADGQQKRDFVFVEDVTSVILHLMENRNLQGLINLGSGKARSFLDLTQNVFKQMGREEDIEFIDTPEDIRDTYQYFTEAKMEKLRNSGYNAPFHSLEEGVAKYVGWLKLRDS